MAKVVRRVSQASLNLVEPQLFVAYFRVSRDSQNNGIDVQREDVARFLSARPAARIIAEYQEVQSGGKNDRPELAKAVQQCKLTGATLLIAKLDRLSRNAAFLLGLRDSGVNFICCDNPQADRLTIGVLAMVAERERDLIRARTKSTLALKKAQGVKLGGWRATRRDGSERLPGDAQAACAGNVAKADAFAAQVLPIVRLLRDQGLTLQQIADELNERHVQTRNGGAWMPMTVRRVLARA